MTDRIVVIVGAVLGVGSLLVAAVVIRPQPHSWREVTYAVLPLAGAVALALLAWARV